MENYTLNIRRLAERRKLLGITKMETAKRTGISQPAYVRYEAGDRTPSMQVIMEIARVLGTSAEYLTNLTDSPDINMLYVEKSSEPELFDLVSKYRSASDEEKKAILANI